MRKYLLHVLIISFVFIAIPITYAAPSLQTRGIEPVLIRDSAGEEVGLYKESYALVIGIDNYTKGWSRLRNAVKDADSVAEELKKRGFKVTLLKDLTGRVLREKIRQFFARKGSNLDARLLLWFSGHGYTIDGEGFLVPADGPLHTSDEFKVTSLHMREFGSLVRLAKSKHVLSIFDSCFAGTIFDAREGVPSVEIKRKTMLPVRQFLTSGDVDQRVRDDGSFSELFLRAIRGEEEVDTNKDGYITGSELGVYLAYRVSRLTNAAQTPRHGKLHDVRYDRGDFVFALNEPQVQLQISPVESGKLDYADIEVEREKARKIAEIKEQWSKWQSNLDTAYEEALKYDNDSYLSASRKAQMWKRLANSFSQDNPYSTEDQLIRSKAVERMEYWKNYREPVKPPVTIRQKPSYVGTSITKLRSSYKTLSVSQVQSMPNMSIRKQKKWGFFGQSTINHDCNLKTISGDKVVVDNAIGLMWHQSGSAEYMDWNAAKKWVRSLNSRGYAGHHDWRLPTVDEAASLLESNKRNDLYIDPVFSKKQRWIWTGDKFEDEDGSEAAWRVFFDNGIVTWDLIFYYSHVRPVRSVE